MSQPDPNQAPTPLPYATPGPPQFVTDKDARLWGMLCHLAAFAGYVGIPLGHILGPLVVWLIKKEQYPFVDDQGKESLNFQISMTIYAIISAILMLVIVGFFLFFAVLVIDVVCVIIAAVKANSGQAYRYPLTIRFLK